MKNLKSNIFYDEIDEIYKKTVFEEAGGDGKISPFLNFNIIIQ